ncbi:hypothetical protein NPS01_24890 [Nocardioides psychrotolerans]|uniref:Uncharacterized protein n=1 Tax=Nocardioides psychrotolerans TaxID=1005945 RepID=A0A1I3L3H8_9ACTN|nr:hypothetical protein [Nocardioides psychrotolerans]GEP38826.1 hypothetical protein NPS01_24890 [Nocardioides psychrotolerans]SFI79261.1 hypothetical protein SAMN05216561_11314 [Nocardioides psychrotolerans]
MDILLWLVPPAVVTVVAMAWVSWLGREGRGEVDRDVAVRRLGEALERSRPVPGRSGRGATTPSPTRQPDRSTGIAVRPSRASAPRPVLPSVLPVVAADRPAVEPPDEQSRRRVS